MAETENLCNECGLGCYDETQQPWTGSWSNIIIDDSNIWCNRVLAVRCDGVHYYVDPCSLCNPITQEAPTFWWLSDVIWPCIPNGIIVANADCTGVTVKNISWLTSQISWLDTKVKVNALDPFAWYLSQKIISTDGSVQVLTDPTNSFINLKVPPTRSLDELFDGPMNYSSCAGWLSNTNPKFLQVNFDGNGWDWYCIPKTFHAEAWSNISYEVTQSAELDEAYFVALNQTWEGDLDGSASPYIDTTVLIDGTNRPSHWIEIPETWRYQINAWANCIINKYVHGIRFAVLIQRGWSYEAILDMWKHARGVIAWYSSTYNLPGPSYTDDPGDYTNSPFIHEEQFHQHRSDSYQLQAGDRLTLIVKMNTTNLGTWAITSGRIYFTPNNYSFNFGGDTVYSNPRDTGCGISVFRIGSHTVH